MLVEHHFLLFTFPFQIVTKKQTKLGSYVWQTQFICKEIAIEIKSAIHLWKIGWIIGTYFTYYDEYKINIVNRQNWIAAPLGGKNKSGVNYFGFCSLF